MDQETTPPPAATETTAGALSSRQVDAVKELIGIAICQSMETVGDQKWERGLRAGLRCALRFIEQAANEAGPNEPPAAG